MQLLGGDDFSLQRKRILEEIVRLRNSLTERTIEPLEDLKMPTVKDTPLEIHSRETRR